MAAAQRKEGETFINYRERLKAQAVIDKRTSKGRLFWNSAKLGTYCKLQK